MIGRFIGWFFLLAGVLVLLRDFWVSFTLRHWTPIALGQLWYDIDRSSLVIAQAAVQRYIGLRAWSIIDAMLIVWASVALGVLGMALLVAFRRRHDVVE